MLVARLLGARCSLLAARHSWPISLARCSDEVGGFNDGYDVFDWFPVRARDMRPWRGLVTDPRSHPPRSPIFLLRRRFAIPVEALEDRSLDSLARRFFLPTWAIFHKGLVDLPSDPVRRSYGNPGPGRVLWPGRPIDRSSLPSTLPGPFDLNDCLGGSSRVGSFGSWRPQRRSTDL